MVDNQKVVVILLLITIILSVASVIVTMSGTNEVKLDTGDVSIVTTGDSDSQASVGLRISQDPGAGG
jgi:hypothetical protein